ncbi:MAG: hypothetical protein UW22_C0017G0017 [Candidatus Gottesmanbacteria bacterium GW2011_GWB1_44_11c]|uniref:Uncharacterized protein n=1 Tax=Candidatus Gottesmanbacteria bacterium GW2011_GWB1_44_11c TaxID=1618447 RepID=A0A0G1JQY5_9BACT|nr:MAG: hypothetical protein UW22_C0017G0017 [Candidatus Gottesmanbacteria bacterium GW2011_GWB1_44_11c]
MRLMKHMRLIRRIRRIYFHETHTPHPTHRSSPLSPSRVLQKDRFREYFRYGVILGIAVGIAILVFKTGIKDVQAIWSPTLGAWAYRQQLNIVNSSSVSLSANTTIAVSIDTKALINAGKLKSDCSDLRIAYQPSDSSNTVLTHHPVYPAAGTCGSLLQPSGIFGQLRHHDILLYILRQSSS